MRVYVCVCVCVCGCGTDAMTERQKKRRDVILTQEVRVKVQWACRRAQPSKVVQRKGLKKKKKSLCERVCVCVSMSVSACMYVCECPWGGAVTPLCHGLSWLRTLGSTWPLLSDQAGSWKITHVRVFVVWCPRRKSNYDLPTLSSDFWLSQRPRRVPIGCPTCTLAPARILSQSNGNIQNQAKPISFIRVDWGSGEEGGFYLFKIPLLCIGNLHSNLWTLDLSRETVRMQEEQQGCGSFWTKSHTVQNPLQQCFSDPSLCL